jgi:sugar-specific transcriptional regulator TrmB
MDHTHKLKVLATLSSSSPISAMAASKESGVNYRKTWGILQGLCDEGLVTRRGFYCDTVYYTTFSNESSSPAILALSALTEQATKVQLLREQLLREEKKQEELKVIAKGLLDLL